MSVLSQVQGLAGVRAAKTVSHRMITYGAWIPDILPAGRIISGACTRDPGNSPDVSRIRAGLLMGKISSVVNSLGTVGYYAPSIIDVTAGAKAVGDTTVTISAAGAVELVRRCGTTGTFKLTGPGSAGGIVMTETVTYSAVNTSTGAITVTAIVNNYVAGSFVTPTDGSEDMLSFMPSDWPNMATDFDGTNIDVEWPDVPVHSIIDSTKILPVWPSDTSLREYIVSRINRASGGKHIWSHNW